MSPRASRIIRRVAIGLLVVLVVVAAWLGREAYIVYSGVSEITDKQVARPTGEPTFTIPTFGGHHRVNFLLLGSDNDQKKEEAAPLTQSMIVVTVDPVRDQVGIVSIPRDFYVPIPGHGYDKIDLAFKYGFQKGGMDGGVQLARLTVERLFHIQIDYYGWVGLSGFSRVIDTFGGVTVDVQHPVLDDSYPNDIHSPDPYGMRRLFIPAGWQHMNGPSALEYVRSRHGDIHGDFGRSQRQQQVLLQVRQKINASNILTNLPSLVSDLEGSVRTDLDLQQLYELDQLSHRIPKGAVSRLVLQAPTYCAYAFLKDGESILQPKWKVILPQVRRMFAPVPPPTPVPSPTSTPAGPTPTPPPTATARPARSAAPAATPTRTPIPGARLPSSFLYVSDGDIYRADPGGATTRLTYSHDAAMPELSPDGKTLAFVRFTDGLHKFDKYASDIWLMDLATRREHVITSDESAVAANNLWALWPTWSPNGKRIVFSSDRTKLPLPINDFRKIDLGIWAIPAGGGKPSQLTNPQQGAGGDTDPLWRPRSSQVLYVSWGYPSESAATPTSQFILRDTRTGRANGLTAATGRVLQPAWSPDGRSLAYVQGTGGADQLVVESVGKTLKGGVSHPRVLTTGRLAQPSFTPDGRYISFLRFDGDTLNLYLIPAHGGQIRLVSGVQGTIDARWRPMWTR